MIRLFVMFLFIPTRMAFCDAPVEAVIDPALVVVEGDEFIQFLIKSIGGIGGMGTLAIVGCVAQVIQKGLQVKWLGKMAGEWKYISIYALNIIGGVSALTLGVGIEQPLTFLPALVHAHTLAAFSLFGHQGYKQYMERKKRLAVST